MAALFVASLAVPQAFGDDAVIFGVAYVVVRAMHVALYAMATRDDPQLRHAIGTLAPTLLASGVLVLVACLVDDGALRYGLWIAALAINVAGPVLGGVEDWRIHPGHFSERHALFVIIALGESIVAAGVGIGGQELDAALAAAAALTIAVTAALWWTYFDIGVHVAERKLKQLQGGERARMARDSFTFIHLLMIAGIILFALGAKKTLEHVDEPLKWEAAVALCGGLALYFAGQIAFRLRNVRSFSRRRTTLMVALLALIPVAHEADALIALAIAAAACWTLIAYELLRYGDARQRYRHTEEHARMTAVTCPLCEATCGLDVTFEGDQVVRVVGDAEDVFSKGFICPKGGSLGALHHDPDRLRTPLIRRDGELVEATWDEAFAEIDRRLAPILASGDKNAIGVYAGNPSAHNLAALLYGRVFNKALGSRNVFSASSVDQMPKHVSAGMMFGGALTIPVPDLDRTMHLLVLGANPLASNGSLMTAPDARGRLRAIRERGGKVVVVDPRRSRTAEHADEHHFIRPGTDALLLFALVHVLFDEDLTDPHPLADGRRRGPRARGAVHAGRRGRHDRHRRRRDPPHGARARRGRRAPRCTAASARRCRSSARSRAGSSTCSTR